MGGGGAIEICGVTKTYANGFLALEPVTLSIRRGEIFALLGPNGAGKTTLISVVCGIVAPTGGTVTVCGYDHVTQYRKAREAIGLVPQELTTDAFETVYNTVSFSRGVFGKPKNPGYIEDILKKLALWDKKDEQIRRLSGGMKRRVMIAKALAHEPEVLFLDEPSAGVDVELRKSMWAQVEALRRSGVTVVLTTHYIEEAQEIADRVGIINKGRLIVTEDKKALLHTMGKREMIFTLRDPLSEIPENLEAYPVALSEGGGVLTLTYNVQGENDVSDFLEKLYVNGVRPKDIQSRQSSLEEIFMEMVGGKR